MRRSFVVLVLFVVGICPVHAGEQVQSPVAVGELLPDVPMQGLNGPSSRTSAYVGRPLIINVWASWCGPCRQEMASLERLAWRDTGRFSVIGISTDDYAHRARAFLAGTHATLPHYIDERLRLERLLGASRLPLTVLVSADGRILEKVYGAREWDGERSGQLLDRLFGPAR